MEGIGAEAHIPRGIYKFSTVGLDRDRVSTISVGTQAQVATSNELAQQFIIVQINLYGIEKIDPIIADSRGGTEITVTGEGFSTFDDAFCMFGTDEKNIIPAIVHSASRITSGSLHRKARRVAAARR